LISSHSQAWQLWSEGKAFELTDPSLGERGDATGDAIFAEGQIVCREQNIGHSAKTHFAECSPRQRKTLGKSVCAESKTLGKKEHSAKIGGRYLCRVYSTGHSAKNQFAESRQ
jgi:hypothetical protein